MAKRLRAQLSLKMILTSTGLVLVIVVLSAILNAISTRRLFDEWATRLAHAQQEAIQKRGLLQVETLAETTRTALMQSDYGTLGAVVPEAAKKDPDILSIYVIADTGIVVAHSNRSLAERPVQEVDPELGPKMAQISEPVAQVLEGPSARERRYVFAVPVVALGRRQGTLVVTYSLRGLELELQRIEADRIATRRAQVLRGLVMGLIFVLVGTALAIWQGLRISQPIKLLAQRADQIAHGDMSARAEVTSSDEIGLLAENFNYMADRLQVLLQETAAKATLEKELELARTIQDTLVPSGDLIDRGTVRIAGYFQPAMQCGGDWWTAHDLPDGKVLVVIGDVTGHGVPSAMITAAAKAACDVVRTLDGAHLTPGRLLSLVNRAIYEAARRRFVMTCFACIIDTRTRTVTYSNAGHNFPYLYRHRPDVQSGESEFTVLMARGNRLGDVAESTYTESSQPLRPGDVLIFYTDGIVECENAAGEEYGEKRFRASIRNAGDLDAAQMRDAVVAAATTFYGDRAHKDDITLVVARIR
ncbi:MAG: SpoIIE family protein phosphatase [Myxococcales bacterium]|nr:SpoIIE family protein phosphatase [Myxococcota bacterium]MDW8284003.1 SpoIIE family protein phosphatase [Myxococcales bacterium]